MALGGRVLHSSRISRHERIGPLRCPDAQRAGDAARPPTTASEQFLPAINIHDDVKPSRCGGLDARGNRLRLEVYYDILRSIHLLRKAGKRITLYNIGHRAYLPSTRLKARLEEL